MDDILSLPASGRVLCAVSGGADSMCLLHKLWSQGTDVCAAHFEHGIRGGESLRDAEFVENWCREHEIRCVVGHGDVPAFAAGHAMGIEEAARQLRYEFLERTADELDCDYIATAHNADDNAETMIFNLCRGTGSAGLRGIPGQRGRILRPLLGLSRREIEEYLEKNAVPHVEDGTNSRDEYSRNLIRHKVVPVLREINPELSKAAARTAELLAQDEDCLSAMADDFIKAYFDGESLPCRELLMLHGAVSSRVIRKLAERSLSMEQTRQVLELAGKDGLAWTDIPGQRLRVEQGRLWFSKEERVHIPERELCIGGKVEIPEAGLAFSAEIMDYGGEINDLFKTYYLKYENINGSVVLTGRRSGDTVRPQGRGCTKSLKKLFLEKGFTQRQRDTAVVLRDSEGILAVYGLAADERCTPDIGDRVLKITVGRIG